MRAPRNQGKGGRGHLICIVSLEVANIYAKTRALVETQTKFSPFISIRFGGVPVVVISGCEYLFTPLRAPASDLIA